MKHIHIVNEGTKIIDVNLVVANNRAQEYWAFSAPKPHFDPAGVNAPAPLPVHNF